MTNEEKAREIQANDVCCVWNGGCPNVRIGVLEAMQWKDEQFEAEKQALIDKACEWLKENVSKHLHGQYAFLKGEMIEEFKQAMEGGRI